MDYLLIHIIYYDVIVLHYPYDLLYKSEPDAMVI